MDKRVLLGALAAAVVVYFLTPKTPTLEKSLSDQSGTAVTSVEEGNAVSATSGTAPASPEESAELAAIAARRAPIEPDPGQVYELPNNLTLLPIPTGYSVMGDNDGKVSEKPAHKVTITYPYWMSKTEITFAQYDAYAEAAGVDKPNDEGWGRGTMPAINISWNDAQGYVKWLSANNTEGLQCRLPSEAEWEHAARAGTLTQYFWGDEASHEHANYGKEEFFGRWFG